MKHPSPEAIAVGIKLKPKKAPLFDAPEDDEDEMPEDTQSDEDMESEGDMGQMVLDAMAHRDPEALEEAIRKIVESCK